MIAAVVLGVTWDSTSAPAAQVPPRCTVPGLTMTLRPDQAANAATIADVARARGLPQRAVVIALATAQQESGLRNLPYGDRDSLGLFQQRPSQGWGTAAQIQRPVYSINKFYDALAKIHGYQSMRITEAAQKVQRSGFPEAYQDHAPDARTLASVLTGYSPGGKFTCVVHQPASKGSGDRVVRLVRRAYGAVGIARTGKRQDVALEVHGATGRRLGWSVAQFVVAHGGDLRQDLVAYDGKHWRTGRASEDGWTKGSEGSATRLVIEMG
jgi:hypothetical protein